MDSNYQLMFALQSPVGLRFGVTTAVESDRISFEMDLKIPKGMECPFRMELSGSGETVLGTIRIERSMPKRGNNLPRYVGRILEMPDSDRYKFDGWRRDMATGGVSRKLERDPETLKEHEVQTAMSGLTEAESKAVLDRMDSRRSTLSPKAEEPTVDFGLTEEAEAESPNGGAHIREKLRKEAELNQESAPQSQAGDAISTGFAMDVEPEPVAVPSSTPPTVPKARIKPEPQPSPPKRVPSPAVKSPPPSAEPASPPMVVVNADARPIEITIIYLSLESFVFDYHRTLHTSAVTLKHPDLNELYQPVDVKIQMHDGDSIEVMGQMVAQTPSGMAIALELDTVQRARLAELAGS